MHGTLPPRHGDQRIEPVRNRLHLRLRGRIAHCEIQEGAPLLFADEFAAAADCRTDSNTVTPQEDGEFSGKKPIIHRGANFLKLAT